MEKIKNDWMTSTTPNPEMKNLRQEKLPGWKDKDIVPTGRIEVKATPKRRVRGKLSKAEQKTMKGCHNDIGTLFKLTVTDTHTPRPGPTRSKVPPDNSSVLGPRAGFDEQVECEIRPNCTPDMRNSVSNCRNKIIQPVRLDNSPSVVYDRVEQFIDILGMIKHWEGMELRENENFEEGGRPRKIKLRKSEEIQRLSTRFEGDDKDKIRLDRHRADGGGEDPPPLRGREIFSFVARVSKLS